MYTYTYDLLSLSPLSINNYVQCTIKYLQNSSTLIKVVQEKNNRISFYQKSLKELIDIYNKLYNANQLGEAQELIQEIQKIRIFSSRLSKSLEIGISLNKQIIKETQKKPCYINNLQAIEVSQANIITQSNSLEEQLTVNLEKAYRLINQTQFKKSQQLISNLNSSSSLEVKSQSSSDSSSSSSSSEDSSSLSSSNIPISPNSDSDIVEKTTVPQKPEAKTEKSKNNSNQSASNSISNSTNQSSASATSSTISSSNSSSDTSSLTSSSTIVSSSNPSSQAKSVSSSTPIPPSSSSSSVISSSNLIPDEDLGNLASN